eukprot:Awhi_evm2s2025
MNLVMAGCKASERFGPFVWAAYTHEKNISLTHRGKQDEYCKSICIRSSFHSNPVFNFLVFPMPTGHEECYYKTRNLDPNFRYADVVKDWDGKLFLAEHHANFNTRKIQYMEKNSFKTEADSI